MNGRLTLPPGLPDSGAELSRIVTALVDDFGARRVIAFGSCTRGESTRDSDVDLCVVYDATRTPRCDASRLADECVSRVQPRLSTDLLVVSLERWARETKRPCGLWREIAEGGVILHEG
jgi:predicted nucleotidyltransferase